MVINQQDLINQRKMVVLCVTLQLRLHMVTKRTFGVIPKVFLLKFFLPKSNPILLGILKLLPDKSDFFELFNVFIETGVLDKQE